MKKNIVYLMLASLLLFTGCANYLDQDPEDLNSMDKIFSSKIETTKWYNRIYSDDFMVQEMHYSGQIPYFWCTDESAYILESHVRNIAEGKMSPDNYYGYTGYNLYFFVRYYQAIRHCNLFLENVDKCAELGEIDRRTMRAEARFMRAYYHYLLLRLYGPIPIVETSRSADQIGASQARNTLGECVRWINGEIDWACENGMPAARDEKFTLGLPTIGAARAIQSRMLLMVASPLFNGNSAYKNWTNHDGTVLMPQTYDKELWKDAADAAKTVIDMTEYQLLKPAADATFDEIVDNLRAVTTTWGAGKNTEIIWGHPNSVQWYGMCALPARWYGWNGRYSLAIGMINDFFMADGSPSRPLEEWFASKKFSAEAGNGTIANTFWMFVDREPRFYASVHFPNQRLSYAYENKTDSYQDADGYGVVDFWYSGLSGNGSTPGDKNTSGFSVRKNLPLDYRSNKQTSEATRMLNVPFPIIRLGEVYLNYAEALNEYYGTSRQDEALYYLNEIRTRAGIP
ncbi:MAG: RagB/SusD family nutrient uptake outer membrane protein, partial [Alistipes onderdonkii]|nr:RagB/SusD family nutrient uptake outer membrane protein [Alistipes onderdonkii]